MEVDGLHGRFPYHRQMLPGVFEGGVLVGLRHRGPESIT